jgi:hypothetical protein
MGDEVGIGEINRNLLELRNEFRTDIRELSALVRFQNGRVGLLERKVDVVETRLSSAESNSGSSKTVAGLSAGAGAALTMFGEFVWKKLTGG